MYALTKTQQTKQLKFVHFTEYDFYLRKQDTELQSIGLLLTVVRISNSEATFCEF